MVDASSDAQADKRGEKKQPDLLSDELFIGDGKTSINDEDGLTDLLIGGETLAKEDELQGNGQYKVINPLRNYFGKSYAMWVTDWFNWFISAEADTRNYGPVVYLRSHGLPDKSNGVYAESSQQTEPLTESNEMYRAVYVNDPNIRIGSERLQIFDDQAVFVPIITAYSLSSPSQLFKDWGRMQEFTGLTIDYGDNPPGEQQLTVNGKAIKLGGMSMRQFRVVTPVFTAVVPDAPYGSSLKDFLEDSPIAPGSYPALVEGYFVMLKFVKGNYWVHSWASAPREVARPYFSELLYQIEVRGRNEKKKDLMAENETRTIEQVRPAHNLRIFNRTLNKMSEIKELSKDEKKRFMKFFKTDEESY